MRLAEASPIWTPAAQPWPEIISFDTVSLPEFPNARLARRVAGMGGGRVARHANAGGLGRLAGPGGLLVGDCPARGGRTAPGWAEPVNLFVAVLLEPGNRKSAVFCRRHATACELEAELIEAARPSVARAQSDRRQAEARLQKLEKLAAEKGDDEARHEAGKLAAELASKPSRFCRG